MAKLINVLRDGVTKAKRGNDVIDEIVVRTIAEGFGRWSWLNGATDKRGKFCDCVGIEESDLYTAWCEFLGEYEGEDGPLAHLSHTTMYETARQLAKVHGDRGNWGERIHIGGGMNEHDSRVLWEWARSKEGVRYQKVSSVAMNSRGEWVTTTTLYDVHDATLGAMVVYADEDKQVRHAMISWDDPARPASVIDANGLAKMEEV
jgi:hypothetical protein